MAIIEIAHVEPRLVAMVRTTVAFALVPQRDARRALAEVLRTAGIDACGPQLAVAVASERRHRLRAGVFVSRSFQTSGGVSVFELPAGRAARATMNGSFEGLPSAWQVLL